MKIIRRAFIGVLAALAIGTPALSIENEYDHLKVINVYMNTNVPQVSDKQPIGMYLSIKPEKVNIPQIFSNKFLKETNINTIVVGTQEKPGTYIFVPMCKMSSTTNKEQFIRRFLDMKKYIWRAEYDRYKYLHVLTCADPQYIGLMLSEEQYQ